MARHAGFPTSLPATFQGLGNEERLGQLRQAQAACQRLELVEGEDLRARAGQSTVQLAEVHMLREPANVRQGTAQALDGPAEALGESSLLVVARLEGEGVQVLLEQGEAPGEFDRVQLLREHSLDQVLQLPRRVDPLGQEVGS